MTNREEGLGRMMEGNYEQRTMNACKSMQWWQPLFCPISIHWKEAKTVKVWICTCKQRPGQRAPSYKLVSNFICAEPQTFKLAHLPEQLSSYYREEKNSTLEKREQWKESTPWEEGSLRQCISTCSSRPLWVKWPFHGGHLSTILHIRYLHYNS